MSEKKSLFCCTCVYGKFTPLLLKTSEETMINENEGSGHGAFTNRPRLQSSQGCKSCRFVNQAKAVKVADLFWVSFKYGAKQFQKCKIRRDNAGPITRDYATYPPNGRNRPSAEPWLGGDNRFGILNCGAGQLGLWASSRP
jgi:hypothetical protein